MLFWLIVLFLALMYLLPQIIGGLIVGIIMLPFSIRASMRAVKPPPSAVTKSSLDEYIK